MPYSADWAVAAARAGSSSFLTAAPETAFGRAVPRVNPVVPPPEETIVVNISFCAEPAVQFSFEMSQGIVGVAVIVAPKSTKEVEKFPPFDSAKKVLGRLRPMM